MDISNKSDFLSLLEKEITELIEKYGKDASLNKVCSILSEAYDAGLRRGMSIGHADATRKESKDHLQ